MEKNCAIEWQPETGRPLSRLSRSALAEFRGRPEGDRESRASRELPAWSARCGFHAAWRSANPVARTRELPRAAATAGERASDRYFDFARGYGQRHAQFGPDGQAFADCFSDVRFSFGLCLPLADAARYRGTLGNVRAVFVLINA